MTVARLALKNLWRSPRRSVLTTVAVVAGVGVLILGKGFIAGLDENIIVSAIDGTVGHVMARPKGYPTTGLQRPIDELLNVTDGARRLLDREAVAWTERLHFGPIAANGTDNLRVSAIGYDPERDPRVFPRDHWKLRGSWPAPDGDEVLVSQRVARLLRLEPGGRMILQVRTHRGAINALEVGVSGIVATGNSAIDMLGVLVPQSLARRLVAAEAPTHLSVKLADRDAAPSFARSLGAALGSEAEVVTWIDETADLLRVQQIRRRALDIIVFILMALAGFGIANTILMAAHERVREIGTLRSMGMTEGGVLRLFLFEGAVIGLVGSTLGALWGGGLVAWWARHPIDFSAMMERAQSGDLSFSALVYTQLSPATVGAAMLLGVAIAVLASIYPGRVAARMVPADAVRAS